MFIFEHISTTKVGLEDVGNMCRYKLAWRVASAETLGPPIAILCRLSISINFNHTGVGSAQLDEMFLPSASYDHN